MRVPIGIVVALAAMSAGAGCGRGEDSTPVACLEGAGAYTKALAGAPGEVRLGGETAISDCLVENQSGGDLARVGEAMVEAATRLNAEARAWPGGDASLRLGYLIGAAQRGAERTEGIHSDLVRRLTVAARFAPGQTPLSGAFYRAYRSGYAAGHDYG
jgi:hypothetical protein